MAPKIAIITGPDLRHRYFCRRINHHFPIELILVEQVSYPDLRPDSQEEQAAVDWFFQRRADYEQAVYGPCEQLTQKNSPPVLDIPDGQLNTRQTRDAIHSVTPDLILLFASGILDSSLLSDFPDRFLNLHVGLSNHYRGSSSNFWPIHDGRLECLGATIIKVDPGIDTGDILAQTTFPLRAEDDEQTLMGNSLVEGTTLMIQAIQNRLIENPPTHFPKPNGRLFLKKDFNSNAILKVRNIVESGQLKNWLKERLKKGQKII